MSEEVEKVLRVALKAVLVTAQELYVDTDKLSEAAVHSMLREKAYGAEDVALATVAIEVAADSLPINLT